VLLTYETRTAATDDQARLGIRRYWSLLSPFIGIVLRGVLNGVKQRVEKSRGSNDGTVDEGLERRPDNLEAGSG
jgi:hypothetical protein